VTFRRMRFDEDAGPLEPGMWRPFPVGGVNFYPDASDGVLIVEESTVTGVPEAPVTVELRDNVVTDITGGVDADRLRRFGPTGYYLRHAFIGLNPRVRLRGGTQFEREKHAGAFYLGIDGLTPDGRPDRSGPGHAHCDCQFDRPTMSRPSARRRRPSGMQRHCSTTSRWSRCPDHEPGFNVVGLGAMAH
jgi:2,5-dihydroxypyridine 5,6-dioxygenase